MYTSTHTSDRSTASRTNEETEHYRQSVEKAADLIADAEHIVLGIGSGLSAAGGLNYADPELVRTWYPEYYSLGFRSIVELQSAYWYIGQGDLQKYWGFWAQHIYHVRYEASATEPYLDLRELMADKEHFIITTNCDSQIEKAGFSKDRIFAMQGNYCYFQCSRPCNDELFYNEQMINTMVENMDSPFEIREEDIPRCPHCGALLMPNLRCDGRFVEKPHLVNASAYERFINDHEGPLLLLEMGIGYNTPVIIRYPFERLTLYRDNVTLIRINLDCADVPKNIERKSLSIEDDLRKVLHDLRTERERTPRIS